MEYLPGSSFTHSLVELDEDSLSSGRKTAYFPRTRWNEIVEAVKACMDAAGEEWDAAYGSINETLFDIANKPDDRTFTAKRFNAVTYNIEKLIKNKWKWAVDDSVKGFLNRARVRGVTEAGSNADTVYGWYIIELARVVNLLINILKDNADFAELGFQGGSETNVKADLVVAKSLPINVQALSASIVNAKLCADPAAHLDATVLSGTNKHAELTVAKSFPLESLVISGTNVKADLKAMLSAGMESHVSSGTSVHAELAKNIYSAKMKFQGSSWTNVFAEISFHNGIEILGRTISESITHAALSKAPPLSVSSYQNSRTSVYAQIKNLESFLLASKAVSSSEIHAEMALTEPMHIYSQLSSESSVWSKMVLPRVDWMYAMAQSGSTVSAEMLTREPILAEAHIQSQTQTHAELRNVEPKHMESASVSSSAVHAEASLVQPLYATSESNSESSAHADLTIGRPMDLKVEALIQSMSYAELVNILPARMVSEAKSGTTVDAELLRKKAANMAAHITCGTNVHAVLSFWEPEPEETWYDPVQNGTDLYVRNAYPRWKENANVHLDSGGVFYEAEQTETNVYIRSAESLKGV